MDTTKIERGDYVEVDLPAGTVRATALTDITLGWGGSSLYSVGIDKGAGVLVEIELNSNFVKPRLIFSASLARETSSTVSNTF